VLCDNKQVGYGGGSEPTGATDMPQMRKGPPGFWRAF
jgi:hypothetical protein